MQRGSRGRWQQCSRATCLEYLTKCSKQRKQKFDNLLGVSSGVRKGTIPSTAEAQSNRLHLDQSNPLSNFITCMGSPGTERVWCTYPRIISGIPGPSLPAKRGLCRLTLPPHPPPPPSKKACPAPRFSMKYRTDTYNSFARPPHPLSTNSYHERKGVDITYHYTDTYLFSFLCSSLRSLLAFDVVATPPPLLTPLPRGPPTSKVALRGVITVMHLETPLPPHSPAPPSPATVNLLFGTRALRAVALFRRSGG